jgi:predicted protein tyrosine phosphatase
MIKKILVRPRQFIENFINLQENPIDSNWALISIWDSYELLQLSVIEKFFKIGCEDFISLKFADLTSEQTRKMSKEEILKHDIRLFNEEQAKQILNFINKINKKNIETLFIHCAAGISRSGAVGLFTCRYLKLNEKQFRTENIHIFPNTFILELLNKIAGLNNDYEKFWENLDKTKIISVTF